VWCDPAVAPATREKLIAATAGRALVLPPAAGPAAADIVLGQPAAAAVVAAPRVRWVQVTAAGFTSFDRPEIRAALGSRGTVVTNSSVVYADACAQHALALMLAACRELHSAHRHQLGDHAWPQDELRRRARVLTGATIVLLGFGAIGERLAELLAPFGAKVTAIRRQPRGSESVAIADEAALPRLLPEAEHVVNILPLNAATAGYMNADRLALLAPGTVFYNIGRGATVDQDALVGVLRTGRIRAYLDVTEPEPLPVDHPLWTLPNCVITPHAAGGAQREQERLLEHFLGNLGRFARGEPLVNRVI